MEQQQLVAASRVQLEDLHRRATARNSVWNGVAWLAGVIVFAIAFAVPGSMIAMAWIGGVGAAAIAAYKIRASIHLTRWIDGAQADDAQVVVPDCPHCKALPERVAHVDAFGKKRLVLALPDGARATFPFFPPTSECLRVLHAPDSPIAIALGEEPMVGFTTRGRLPRARLTS